MHDFLEAEHVTHAIAAAHAAIAELRQSYTGPFIIGADMQCTPVQ